MKLRSSSQRITITSSIWDKLINMHSTNSLQILKFEATWKPRNISCINFLKSTTKLWLLSLLFVSTYFSTVKFGNAKWGSWQLYLLIHYLLRTRKKPLIENIKLLLDIKKNCFLLWQISISRKSIFSESLKENVPFWSQLKVMWPVWSQQKYLQK